MNCLVGIPLLPVHDAASNNSLCTAHRVLTEIYPSRKDIHLLFHRTDHPDIGVNWCEFIVHLKQLCKQHNFDFDKCKFLFSTQTQIGQLPEVNKKNIYVVDFYLIKEYVYSQYDTAAWNCDAELGLAIIGKLYRQQRIDAVENLIASNGFGHLDWSLRLPQPDDVLYQQTLQTLAQRGLTVDSILPYCRDIDQDTSIKNTWSNTGYPYNKQLYSRSLYSVVIETYVHEPWTFITEKTFKPIAQCQPFMGLLSQWSYARLKRLGFHTFEDLFLPPGQDYSVSTLSNNFTDCVQRFAHNLKINSSRVKKLTQLNRARMIRTATQQLAQVAQLRKCTVLVPGADQTWPELTFDHAILFTLEQQLGHGDW